MSRRPPIHRASRSRSRDDHQRLIAGRNPVLESLRSGTALLRIVLLDAAHGKGIEDIRTMASQRGVRVETMPRDDFMAIAPGVHTQGVVAFAERQPTLTVADLLKTTEQNGRPGLLLLPDQIEDPGNLGALIRTAECVGADGLILVRHHSASLTAGTIKASAGAVEYLPIAETSNLARCIQELKERGYWIVGLDMDGDRHFAEIDYSGPIAIVIGSEGKGIRRLVREQCDFLARIPVYGRLSSLNASVAGALVMYEVARQRRGASS